MSDNALGIRSFGQEPEEENPEEDLMSMFADEETGELEQEPNSDEEPEAPPVEPLPPEEGEEEPAAEEPTEEAPGEEAPQHLYANKYRSPEELERAYLEVTTGFTRVAQENAQARQAQEQMQAQIQAQQEQLAQVAEFLQAQMAEQDPEFAEELQRRMETQQLVDQQVAQRLEPFQQQMQQQDPQAVAAVGQMRAAAEDFYRRHTEIQQGSPEDVLMTQGIVEMMNRGVPIDLRNPEHLDLALEASQNEALAAELMLAPAALEVPGGVARLRQRAGATIASTEASPAENGTRAKAPVRQKVEGFVETGTGGAPQSGAPGKKPDEFDEAWNWYQGRSARGPLFGAKTG